MIDIEETKDLNVLPLEDLIISLWSHRIYHDEYESQRNPMSIYLKSKSQQIKALQAEKLEHGDLAEAIKDYEFSLFSKKVQRLWARRNNKFPNI